MHMSHRYVNLDEVVLRICRRVEAWITRQRMPETHTMRGAGKRGMMLINYVERTVRALCGEIALAGRTSVMGKRAEAEASGPCGNGGSTWEL